MLQKAVVSVERPVTAQFAVQMAPTDLCLKARLAAPNHNNSSSQAKSTQPPLAHQPILARGLYFVGHIPSYNWFRSQLQ